MPPAPRSPSTRPRPRPFALLFAFAAVTVVAAAAVSAAEWQPGAARGVADVAAAAAIASLNLLWRAFDFVSCSQRALLRRLRESTSNSFRA